MLRESKSPHSSPTFCVLKPNGKWRLVHAYNKLNSATVHAQTPIARMDLVLNNMTGCTFYSALDLVDEYYQVLIKESDIPLTAVSTPAVCSGSGWEPIPVGQWSHPDAGTGRSVDRSPPWDEFAQRPERGITISISRFDYPHSVMRGLYPVQDKS
ncbi:unnamed protein product [Phytophthora fragariaefolia]|uniref:Unnamed protein product n=1 Tax=Phytophthora fragariaefolia TaxID=1490495 RepID=A0A9W7CZI5_9STRA|nr:unnamed protein product [Phytophthora fragariaefolia]